MSEKAATRRSRALLLLWLAVLLEVVSPVPLLLSFGAAYVLVARPPWFHRLVADLYATGPADSR